ncbi:MAG: hypothetical protein ACE5FW_00600 [Candidatus Aenigmatarchaeota archaeon]
MRRLAPLLILLLLLPSLALAVSEEALKVQNAVELAEQDMQELQKAGLPVIRYNDTLFLAKQMYEAQLILEEAGAVPDYSLVQEHINELAGIKQKAFRALDELKALELTINQTVGIDLAPVLEIYAQSRDAFDAERYEECLELAEKTYEKISEMEALETKIRAFYEATSRGISEFLAVWWKEILVTLTALVLAVVLTYNRLMMFLIRKRIEGLEQRKESIRKLVAKTQQGYFESRKISEATYHTRIKKFGEIIRDINRQIPLLKEELAMREKRKI